MNVIDQKININFRALLRLFTAGAAMIIIIAFCSPQVNAQQRGDNAYKGDITGRKFKNKKSPRPQWGSGIARPDPYAGRNRKSAASRTKANSQTKRSPSKQREKAWKGGARAEQSQRITFTGKRRYMKGGAGLSISRDPERPRKVKRVTPRSASGAYRVRNRKNPYTFRERSRWEDAFQGDITGRRVSTKRTTDRPGIKKPSEPNYTNRGRRGDKPYQGRISAGFSSVSRNRERAGRAAGGGSGGSIRTTFTGKKRYQGSSAGLSISRDPERPRRIKRITPRSASGDYRVRKRKNPYVFRERSPWEKAFQGDITGRKFRTKRTTERPGIGESPEPNYTSRGRRGDKAYSGRIQANYRSLNDKRDRAWKKDISGNRLRIRTSKKPTFSGTQFKAYPKGKRRGDQPYSGKIKGGGYGSITPAVERAGKPLLNTKLPGEGTQRAWNFQGNIKSSRKPKGGGSISGRWNNDGRAIEGRGPGRQDFNIAGFQGNLKRGKSFKGGGSISRNNWNNSGVPIIGRTPRAQDNNVARFQGNLKGKRILKGGGSISRNQWNNSGQPIQGRALTAQDANVTSFQGNVRKRTVKDDNSRKATNYSGRIPAYMLKKGPDDRFRFTGDMKRRRNYVKNPNAVKESLKVKALTGEDRISGNYRGRIPVYLTKKGPNDYNDYKGNVKPLKYKRNPNAADEALKARKPGETEYLAGNFQGFIKRGPKRRQNKNAAEGSLNTLYPDKDYFRGGAYQGNVKRSWTYKKNPNSADESLKVKPPAKALAEGMRFQGRIKVTTSYKKRPNSVEGALRGIGPSRAAVQASNFQGNLKMGKKRIEDRHPDFKYLSSRSNGKAEKEKFFSFKIFWSKLFKKDENQPDNLKEKERKPRYDKGEEALWYD
ncbi:MAG: hypothetical protein WD555_03150 [Fulvivirga sp.]